MTGQVLIYLGIGMVLVGIIAEIIISAVITKQKEKIRKNLSNE